MKKIIKIAENGSPLGQTLMKISPFPLYRTKVLRKRKQEII